ncbi:hypothetical protein EDD90_9863 [Streptomyces sp. Ag109_O5-1]|uniref:hypothetical protein n=1 Tax=Streptomyces sp. Ag109_O5-1 TaxID=1938851 RepID=UPI000FB7E4ED|nr:hypothetical protein [Streptomyces sp. Ag109_O5-1]RPE46521.1 hypothetical protein EDD90_9863 [Streptomyces sp. Ag109_O5-1]
MAEGLVDGRAPRTAPVDGSDRPAPIFEQLSAVADAVLYEGYLLYPYRRSSPKNRARWQFGVLLPRDRVEADGPVSPGVSGSADSWYQQTECLLRVRRPDAVLRLRVRYLQLQHKQVENGRGQPVDSLTCDDGTVQLTFEEAVPRETDLAVPLDRLDRGEHTVAVGSPAGVDTEALPSGAGRIVRRREELRASTTLVTERLGEGLFRLRVRTANEGLTADPGAPRDRTLRHALIATHTLLGVEGAEFVSLIDPGTGLQEAARSCRNDFTFPVLGGAPPATAPEDGSASALLLSSPIILPDHPQVAPESPGDLHDAGEIDEILTLRTMLLTDEEKREARATDPRAAEILDRVDTMPPEVLGRLHGAIRSLRPADERPGNNRNGGTRTDGDRTDGDRTDGDRSDGDHIRNDDTGSDRTSTDRTGNDRATDHRTGGDRTGGDRTGDHRSDGDHMRNDHTGRDRTSADRTGNDRATDHRTGGDRTGGGRTGDHRSDGDHMRNDHTGSDRTSADRTDNDRATDHRTGGRRSSGRRTGNDRTGGESPISNRLGGEPPVGNRPVGQPSGTGRPHGQPPVTGRPDDRPLDAGRPTSRPHGQPPVTGRPVWWQEGVDDGLSPATDTVLVGGVRVGGGCPVRLRPRGKGADAQDMFLAGRTATVAAVFHDVDGSTHLAVTVDDDPAAELHGWYGRFHYFRPDEVEPLGGTDVPDPEAATTPSPGPSPSEA